MSRVFQTLAPALTRRMGLAAVAGGVMLACSPAPAANPGDEAEAARAQSATRGLDAAMVERALVEARGLDRLHAVIIARDGEVLVEERLRGPGLDTPVNIKSASKSVLSAITGIAIGEGVLEGVDQPVAPVLAADLPASPDPRLSALTVGHLLSMRAGLGRTSGDQYGRWVTSPNWVRHALARPFEDEPGGRMIYSTGTSHLMSAVLTRASGRNTHALAVDWLGEPLGIRIPPWPQDPQGVYFGGNDMLMSPRDLLRFGELYRLDGEIDGRRILPEGWVQESWRSRGVSPWSGNGYGYGWFARRSGGHDIHFAWGYGGQMLFIVPSLDLTVVMISDPNPHPRAESHLPQLHALMDRDIIPAAVRGAAAGG